MNGARVLADRALEAHQTTVKTRLAFETAALHVLRCRDAYDEALTNWEACRQLMHEADRAQATALHALADALRVSDDEKEPLP